MTKLFVIAGHGAGDPGSCANGYTEAERVRALAQRIKDFGGDSVSLGDFDRNYYRDGGVSDLGLGREWMTLELHLDSTAGARGGHVEIWHKYEPDSFDVALGDFIAGFFPGRADKIRKRPDLSNLRRAATAGVNYRLLEVCFITSADDINKFNERLDDVATGILSAAGIDSVDDPPAAPETPTKDESHEGSSGFEGGTYRCTVDGLRIRSEPSLNASVVGSYSKGETVVLDPWYSINDGFVWGRYTGSSSGKKRYVAVGKPTGGYDPSDYLVKA